MTPLMSKKYQSNFSSYRVFNPVNNNNNGDTDNMLFYKNKLFVWEQQNLLLLV